MQVEEHGVRVVHIVSPSQIAKQSDMDENTVSEKTCGQSPGQWLQKHIMGGMNVCARASLSTLTRHASLRACAGAHVYVCACMCMQACMGGGRPSLDVRALP